MVDTVDTVDMVAWLREGAELVMSEHNELGLVLDGSLESIETVEAYLDDLRTLHHMSSPTPEDEYKVLIALGAYMGEVIINASGSAQWSLGSDDPTDPWEAHIESPMTDYRVYPLGKILRRYQKGAEESLLDFATISIAMFRGDVGFDSRVLH
jgi:hypothetical protein